MWLVTDSLSHENATRVAKSGAKTFCAKSAFGYSVIPRVQLMPCLLVLGAERPLDCIARERETSGRQRRDSSRVQTSNLDGIVARHTQRELSGDVATRVPEARHTRTMGDCVLRRSLRVANSRRSVPAHRRPDDASVEVSEIQNLATWVGHGIVEPGRQSEEMFSCSRPT